MFPWKSGDKVLLSHADYMSKDIVTFIALQDDGQCIIKNNLQENHIVSVDRLSSYIADDVISRADYENYEKAGYSAPTENVVSDRFISELQERYFEVPKSSKGPTSNGSTSIRKDLLAEAAEIISNARDISYGDPVDNFSRIASLWNEYLGPPHNIKAHDVAIMMILLKISRLANKPSSKDNWMDIAGYAGLGYEVHERKL